MGVALARAGKARWTLAACGALLLLFPVAAEVLPAAVRSGLWRTGISGLPWAAVVASGVVAALAWVLESKGKRGAAIELIAAALVLGVVHVKVTTLGPLDRTVSARGLWRQIEPVREQVCLEPIHRAWRYGLNYYSITPLPSCGESDRPMHVRQTPGEPAYLAR
jgi:hypothetical protein